ncbi:MAG: hypothetical protein DYG98_21160 [Haliscomenobacteraceae bacterium CHB4]|nr:hypothetical protein [Haliscomenobacteraceae bacterium CHB4]
MKKNGLTETGRWGFRSTFAGQLLMGGSLDIGHWTLDIGHWTLDIGHFIIVNFKNINLINFQCTIINFQCTMIAETLLLFMLYLTKFNNETRPHPHHRRRRPDRLRPDRRPARGLSTR